MGQTSYLSNFPTPRAGSLYDIGPKDVVSIFSDEDLAFGRFMASTATESKVAAPTQATDITAPGAWAGILMATQDLESKRDGLAPNVSANTPGNSVKRGRIWVHVEQAVALTDPVYVRYTVNGNTFLGDFRKDADTGKAAILPGAKWLTTTSGDGLAALQYN